MIQATVRNCLEISGETSVMRVRQDRAYIKITFQGHENDVERVLNLSPVAAQMLIDSLEEYRAAAEIHREAHKDDCTVLKG